MVKKNTDTTTIDAALGRWLTNRTWVVILSAAIVMTGNITWTVATKINDLDTKDKQMIEDIAAIRKDVQDLKKLFKEQFGVKVGSRRGIYIKNTH